MAKKDPKQPAEAQASDAFVAQWVVKVNGRRYEPGEKIEGLAAEDVAHLGDAVKPFSPQAEAQEPAAE